MQRLSFNEFYRLDKTASREANEQQGNLVLLDQGVEPFARKVLDVDEKRPKVGDRGHPRMADDRRGREDLPFAMAGLKKALTVRGFDVATSS